VFRPLNARARVRNPFREEQQWPQRLLHVASMTSYEIVEGNNYNGIKEPLYNIVSYTWGRFRSTELDAPTLSAKVPWKIPPVDSTRHFSAGRINNLVTTLATFSNQARENEGEKDTGSDAKHVWIDVACIDQGSSPSSQASRMKEIGR
jgi:hypothetical protein